jgi:CDP-6-deoxy-D-xylo-4-hexulose-3-dehydrase
MGYNLKPLDLQGSIGLSQLKKFDSIDEKRKNSKKTIESIILKYVSGISSVESLEKSDTCWFGTPFICDNKEIKDKLISFLEENKIQTRNYFAGNILLHPAFSNLDDIKLYPNSNKVLDKVFFLGAAPHYDETVFNYVDEVFSNKWVN